MSKDTNYHDLFIDFTNQIYWEGYAESIAMEDPSRYNEEFEMFKNDYSA